MQEITYDGNPGLDKVEIWREGKHFRLHIALQDPSLGLIILRSDLYSNIYEADSRALSVARQLGLDRDNLPVHIQKTQKKD